METYALLGLGLRALDSKSQILYSGFGCESVGLTGLMLARGSVLAVYGAGMYGLPFGLYVNH